LREPAIARSLTITGAPKIKTGEFTMIKASKLAIAIAVACPVAFAALGESFATPVSSSAVGVKAPPPVASEVQYRAYGYGYRPYARNAYPYGGYTYWYWYPSYPYWDYDTWNTGNGYY
jgi:hypothetical protein